MPTIPPKRLTGWLAAAALLVAVSTTARSEPDLTIDAVQNAEFSGSAPEGRRDPVVLKAQVLLDRAHVSPGAIDGLFGANVSQAVAAFEKRHGLESDGKLDETVWRKLTEGDDKPVLKRYTIELSDVEGPFLDAVPDSFKEMAKLDRLAYTGPAELLAERFHMDEDLLRVLNPGVGFGEAGAEIVVADPGQDRTGNAAAVEVDKAERAVRAYDGDGNLLAFYPGSIGSEENPAPEGSYEVRAVASDPAYYYNPDKLRFEGVNARDQLKIPPGPNNPVGTVWIDLTKDGFGIHGTPEPASIGKTFSHGCIRLTNWDATELSRLVEKGTTVKFLK